jgi:RNA polymerase sigma-70 factor (ECF subfamily)
MRPHARQRNLQLAAPFAAAAEIVGNMADPVLPLPDVAVPVRARSEAFADWATRLRPALWRYARTLGADASAADDLVQEAFIVTLRRADFTVREPGAVFTFLRTTCKHLWLRSRARRSSEREVDEADRVWTQRCGDGTGDDYVEALRACIATLPERSRELLAMTYGNEAGRSAAGAAFGLSRDGVKSALRRLRSFLHDCIGRRLENDR